MQRSPRQLENLALEKAILDSLFSTLDSIGCSAANNSCQKSAVAGVPRRNQLQRQLLEATEVAVAVAARWLWILVRGR